MKRRSTEAHDEQVHAAAWRLQFTLATRTPSGDPDSVIGATVEHSVPIEEALTGLLNILGPSHPLTSTVVQAKCACADVSVLHESWVAYCAEQARSGTDDETLAMDREFSSPGRVRDWPRYKTARRRTRTLTEQLAALEPQLVSITGRDLAAHRQHGAA
ncbi:hypothetical protein ABZ896_10120 [Streptomyces sp. NPDC047072]|uniref:hypothetical protein n=1 Tax=Streptomyces sp. NPDC047072 TaxID=3154809 RepID=UPI0033C31C0E